MALSYASVHYEAEPDTCFFLAQKAYLESSRLGDPTIRPASASIIGKIHFYQGSFQQASEYLQEAREAYESQDDLPSLAHICTWLGAVYQYARQFPIAMEYYSRGYSINQRISNLSGLAESYGWIGHFYEKTGNPDTARYLQHEALDLYRKMGDQDGMARIYDNLGSVYEDIGEYDSAYHYFEQACKLNLHLGNISRQLVNINNLGDVYRKKGNYAQALVFTDSALKISKKNNLTYQVRSAYRDKSKLFFLMKSMDSAYFYQEKAYDLYTEIFSGENARRIVQLQNIYETERKENQILLLERNKAYNRIIRMVLTGLLSAIMIFSGLILYQQRLKIKQKELLNEQRIKLLDAKDELYREQLKNAILNEARLKVELENKKLQEDSLKHELLLKSQMLTSHSIQIIRKNNFLEDLRSELKKIKSGAKKERLHTVNDLVRSIDTNVTGDEDWNDFKLTVEQVQPDFFSRLTDRYPDLTPSDLRLCALLKLNLSSNDIASILNISSDSLRIARYRLRKKLGLEKNATLFSFLMNY